VDGDGDTDRLLSVAKVVVPSAREEAETETLSRMVGWLVFCLVKWMGKGEGR
jgi:hypothetical protein